MRPVKSFVRFCVSLPPEHRTPTRLSDIDSQQSGVHNHDSFDSSLIRAAFRPQGCQSIKLKRTNRGRQFATSHSIPWPNF